MAEEAYERYAVEANQKTTYLATFRAIAKKYPDRTSEEILEDLVESTPGDEGGPLCRVQGGNAYPDQGVGFQGKLCPTVRNAGSRPQARVRVEMRGPQPQISCIDSSH